MSESEQFASDNYSGICPQAWSAMAEANGSDEPAYGEDRWTQRAGDGLRGLFDTDCDVFFVFNGTAANSLALASMGQSFHSVICHELAHIETDECGGPEYASNGAKLLLGQGGPLEDVLGVYEALRGVYEALHNDHSLRVGPLPAQSLPCRW